MSNTAYVSAAKPKVGGAIYRAPIGTPLPTDSTTALASAFEALGYISQDGLTNANSPNSSTIYAWGGDPVLTAASEKEDTFKCVLLEVLNVAVLKTAYGDDNVTGTLAEGLTITANNNERENAVYVAEIILRGGATKRIVLPNASISAVDDIVYRDNEASGYGLTFSCEPDSAGNTHYEYIKGAAA